MSILTTPGLKEMSYAELQSLIKEATRVQEEKKTKISKYLGDWFQSYIPVDTFLSFRQVEPEQIGIKKGDKYFKGVKPSDLKGENVVAGVCEKRPFIALRVELIDNKGGRIAEVAEVIHKRYAKMAENWVSNLDAMKEDGLLCGSVFYATKGMSDEEMTVLQDVLNGETVQSVVNPMYQIRLAPKKV